ncbi:MAG TPA: hypothetical protein VFZ34_21935, partial [Blastocatellia bacterium]|nr:hypothetical protein [Blastocatellia bacterium]
MQPEHWQQIQAFFVKALTMNAEQRVAFLTEACANDEMRSEVESLLNAHKEAGTFLQAPAAVVAAEARNRHEDATLLSPLGQRVNQYQILARIGAGGMG